MREIKIGDRGTIDYPGTYLDKQPCRVERLNGGELYLVGSFGTTWLFHTRFVPDDEARCPLCGEGMSVNWREGKPYVYCPEHGEPDEPDAWWRDEFDVWWREEGSEIHQLVCENDEQYVKRIARIAWDNGVYKEKHRDYRS